MPSRPAEDLWDLSPAINLLHTLTLKDHQPQKAPPPQKPPDRDKSQPSFLDSEVPNLGLGNFDLVWKAIGALDKPSSSTKAAGGIASLNHTAYISDGATYCPPSSKDTQWVHRQDENTGRSQNGIPIEETVDPKNKKRKRKKAGSKKIAASSDLDADVAGEATGRAPARTASVHQVKTLPVPKLASKNQTDYNLPNGQGGSSQSPSNKSVSSSVRTKVVAAGVDTSHQLSVDAAAPGSTVPGVPYVLPFPYTNARVSQLHGASTLQPHAQTFYQQIYGGCQLQLAPIQGTLPGAVPGSLQMSSVPTFVVDPSFYQGLQPRPGMQAQFGGPLSSPSCTDTVLRNLHLRSELVKKFPADAKWIAAPVTRDGHTNDAAGIHVFIDFSNIWIGFMEQMKKLNHLNGRRRAPFKNISFDSLVLFLERGRPVAKRVLAGSYPKLPAFDDAVAVGYQMKILEKVKKVRTVNDRQKFFNARVQYPKHPTTPTKSNGAQMVGSTTSPGTVEKFVEQGVDEILHLNMLMSVVDNIVASTMVVATGDAAEAEYSDGFKSQIVRALRCGWNVELVCWSSSISSLYRGSDMAEWANKGMFRIIYLDEFAELLLDTEA